MKNPLRMTSVLHSAIRTGRVAALVVGSVRFAGRRETDGAAVAVWHRAGQEPGWEAV